MIQRPAAPELCIVIPCFNEEAVLPHLFERISALELDVPFKVLFVDDGSKDRTLKVLESACEREDAFACLSLSRNFGHQAAVAAGLRHAKGDVVVVLDADLQDPPELLPSFLAKWHDGFDVVYGIRTNRKESWLLRMAYRSFYRMLDRSASVPIPRDAGDFALMDRRVVDVVNALPEHNRFVRGMRAWAGFKQTGVSYERPARYAGETGYSFSRLVKLALDGFMAFSTTPLRMALWIGCTVSVIGFVSLAWLLIAATSGQSLVPPWCYVLALVLLLGGLQIAFLGVVGMYIGRVLDEVRRRPHYILRHSAGWVTDPD